MLRSDVSFLILLRVMLVFDVVFLIGGSLLMMWLNFLVCFLMNVLLMWLVLMRCLRIVCVSVRLLLGLMVIWLLVMFVVFVLMGLMMMRLLLLVDW